MTENIPEPPAGAGGPPLVATAVRKLVQNGRSLALTLPNSVSRALGFRLGDLMQIDVRANGAIDLVRVRPVPQSDGSSELLPHGIDVRTFDYGVADLARKLYALRNRTFTLAMGQPIGLRTPLVRIADEMVALVETAMRLAGQRPFEPELANRITLSVIWEEPYDLGWPGLR